MKSIDPVATSLSITRFLKDTFTAAGIKNAVIGLSGGVDSATSCLVAVRALGPDCVYPVLLPSGKLGIKGVEDARTLIAVAGIPEENVLERDIEPVVQATTKLVEPTDELRTGNSMARVRMLILFDQAKKREAMVVGTENKSEHYLGYFTRFGDEASDIEPLRNLYKTQVYQLAKYLGVPETILVKAPSANLWPGQTDEGEFGFSYTIADDVLSQHIDDKKLLQDIVTPGVSKEIVEKILQRVAQNAFKHHLPYLPK